MHCHCVMSHKDLVLPSNGNFKMKFMDPIRCSDINKSHICPNNRLGSKCWMTNENLGKQNILSSLTKLNKRQLRACRHN
jgi:hypothetical protein